VGVNTKGNQLLASAAVAGNEHRGHRGRHFLDHLQDVPDRFALANDVFEVKFHLAFANEVHHVCRLTGNASSLGR
jgi:hypothetical protein